MKVFITIAICVSIIFYAFVSFSESESDEICCSWFNLKYIKGELPQKVMTSGKAGGLIYEPLKAVKTISHLKVASL